VRQIIDLMPGGDVQLTDAGATVDAYYPLKFAYPYLTVKTPWCVNHSRRVALQLSTGGDHRKNTPLADQIGLKDALERRFYIIDEPGKPSDITQIAKMLAEAEFFIGIESGITHVAHSVGVPTMLLQNGTPHADFYDYHFGNPGWHLFKDAAALIEMMGRPAWAGFLKLRKPAPDVEVLSIPTSLMPTPAVQSVRPPPGLISPQVLPPPPCQRCGGQLVRGRRCGDWVCNQCGMTTRVGCAE
jgi:hypothetical protein